MSLALRLTKLAIFAIITLLIAFVYLKYFKRPPVEVLMKMNKKTKSNQDFGADSFRTFQTEESDNQLKEEDDDNLNVRKDNEIDNFDKDDEDESQDNYWSSFIEDNHLVPIGAVYNKCDGSKVQLGSVVLLENKEEGGLLARTFVNMTIRKNITGGTFFLKVKYNGKDLFENYWELCDLEDDLPVANRTFTCPITPGKWSKVKNKPIPSYLPAGRYQTKAWVVDEKERIIVCGFSDFSL